MYILYYSIYNYAPPVLVYMYIYIPFEIARTAASPEQQQKPPVNFFQLHQSSGGAER